MESGRVFILEDLWTDTFIKELTAFPFVRHDDSVDAFTWALTDFAYNLDAVDRGLQEAIIQNKRFMGSLLREGIGDNSVFTETPVGGKRRRLFSGDTAINDPDFDAGVNETPDPRSHFAAGRRGGGRGHIKYD
jgi:hypothetical protein